MATAKTEPGLQSCAFFSHRFPSFRNSVLAWPTPALQISPDHQNPIPLPTSAARCTIWESSTRWRGNYAWNAFFSLLVFFFHQRIRASAAELSGSSKVHSRSRRPPTRSPLRSSFSERATRVTSSKAFKSEMAPSITSSSPLIMATSTVRPKSPKGFAQIGG